MCKGLVCSGIVGFGEHLRTLEGYHQHRLFHYVGFHVEERFKFSDHNPSSDMYITEIKQARRRSARRKREEMDSFLLTRPYRRVE